MLPNTSPNWSLKLTPCTLDGRSPLMSFTLLRTWTQISGTRRAGVSSLRLTKIVVWPEVV